MIFGPDGLPIHGDPEVPADAPPGAIVAPNGSEPVADDRGRVAEFKQVMRHQMRSAVNAATAFEALMRGRAELIDSDEHGDRKVMCDGQETGLRIHKDAGVPVDQTDYTKEQTLSDILD